MLKRDSFLVSKISFLPNSLVHSLAGKEFNEELKKISVCGWQCNQAS